MQSVKSVPVVHKTTARGYQNEIQVTYLDVTAGRYSNPLPTDETVDGPSNTTVEQLLKQNKEIDLLKQQYPYGTVHYSHNQTG